MNSSSALARKLSQEIQGECLFDDFSRGRYSTDASIYQLMPIGVVVPKHIDDVEAAMDDQWKKGILHGRCLRDSPIQYENEIEGLLVVNTASHPWKKGKPWAKEWSMELKWHERRFVLRTSR